MAVMQGVMLLQSNEAISGGDTQRLLDEARNLIAGRPLGPTGIPFLLPHVILAAVQLAGWPLVAYVYIQVAAAAIAAFALWDLVLLAGGSAAVATVASLIWAINPDTQRWNLFLLSDGFYQSLLIFTTLAIVKAIDQPRATRLIGAAFNVIAIALTRPQGQLWPAILIASIVWLPLPKVFRWCVAASAIALQLALLGAGRAYASHMDMVQHFEHGQIIWGYSGYLFTMPAAPADHAPGLLSVIAYCLQHPFDSSRLMAARIAAELITLRPFYSWAHNAFNAALYLPLLGFALAAWWRRPASTVKTVSVIVVAAHLAFVGASHADSDGRWFMQVFSLIVAWGSIGAAAWYGARSNQGVTR